MSKLKEYLSLVKKGLPNIDKIAEGVLNEVKSEFNLLSEAEQEEITRRRLICNTCPLNSLLAKTSKEYKELYNENYNTDRDDLHCSICACNLQMKTSSLSSNCGLEYYNNNNPNNQKPLLWEKFKTND